jgi:hypothetical protein
MAPDFKGDEIHIRILGHDNGQSTQDEAYLSVNMYFFLSGEPKFHSILVLNAFQSSFIFDLSAGAVQESCMSWSDLETKLHPRH